MADQARFLLIDGIQNSPWGDTLIPALTPLCEMERVEIGQFIETLGNGTHDLVLLNAEAIAALILQLAVLRERLTQAEQLLKLKDDLLWVTLNGGVWWHKIRNHAINIRDMAGIILDDHAVATAIGVCKEEVEKIMRVAEAIVSYPITPPPLNNESLRPISLSEFLCSRFENWRQDPEYIGINFTLHPLPDDVLLVRIVPELLREACDQLVGNAARMMANLPKRDLIIWAERKGDVVEIAFSDSGPGFEVELRDKALITFTPKKGAGNGAGFGLPMARSIVERFDGELKIGSTGTSGTTMIIQLPLES